MAKIRYQHTDARAAARERWHEATAAKREALLPRVLFYIKAGYTHQQVARAIGQKNGYVAALLKHTKQNT
jgi:hypothetical protein